jgi:lipoprotein-anchoring transpeptidase ErfK/SrfK
MSKPIAVMIACAIAVSVMPSAFAASAPTDELTLEEVNDARLTATIARKAKGAAVLRAQLLLDRAHFSTGEIDAVFGINMRVAVAGFQKSNGLDSTGTIDGPTWAALNRDAAPALMSYALSEADVAGPFVPIPADMMEKSKMPALGFGSPAEALGEKFHVSPALLQRLNPGKDLGHAGEEIVVPNIEPSAPIPAAEKLVVDKSNSTVSLLDTGGKVIAQFPASMGSEHDPLPIGNWKVKGVAKNPVFKYNPKLFWDADTAHAKATIPAGPNNPVGIVWIDLSKEHYGIHGTPEPRNIGKTESHGCIRMANWSAWTLSQSVSPGMPAILQE